MRAMSWSEMMALNATLLPMLMSDRRQVMVQVSRIELRGTVEVRLYSPVSNGHWFSAV
jgi:hypothetical protein